MARTIACGAVSVASCSKNGVENPSAGRLPFFCSIIATLTRVAVFIRQFDRLGVRFPHQPLEKGTAPTASRSGTIAIGQLAGDNGFLGTYVLDDFSPRDVKAEAQFFVIVHGPSPAPSVMSQLATWQASR